MKVLRTLEGALIDAVNAANDAKDYVPEVAEIETAIDDILRRVQKMREIPEDER